MMANGELPAFAIFVSALWLAQVASALTEIGREEREHHVVPTPVLLRRHQPAKDTLAGEAKAHALRDTLRGEAMSGSFHDFVIHAASPSSGTRSTTPPAASGGSGATTGTEERA